MSIKLDFSRLGANLSEITYALQDYSKTNQLKLYASSNSNVSYQGTWMGNGYKLVDQGYQCYLSYCLKEKIISPHLDSTLNEIIVEQFEKRIEQIYQLKCKYVALQITLLMRSIHELENRSFPTTIFHYHLTCENVEPSLAKTCIDECVNEIQKPLKEKQIREKMIEIQKSVFNFYAATYQFWGLMLSQKHDHWKKPISELTAKIALAKDKHVYHSLRKLIFRINLEGILRQETPVIELGKRFYSVRLSREEEVRITQWVEGLNKKETKIKKFLDENKQHDYGFFFECIFKDIAETISTSLEIPSCYERLLLLLDERNCQLIRDDPEHNHKRLKLEPGKSVTCNGKTYLLGKKLSSAESRKYTVFALKKQKNCVIKIANNRFQLLIEKQKFLGRQWGIHYVETALGGYDTAGESVVLEKLQAPFSDYKWTSSTPILEEEDQEMALILASHLVHWEEKRISIKGLAFEDLMFDEKRMLKLCKVLRVEAGDYRQWEEFAVKVAKGNPHVLQFIMHVSQLFEHDVAKYYRVPVAASFKIGVCQPSEESGNWEKYKQKLDELTKMACQISQECFTEVMEYLTKINRYEVRQKGELTAEINKKLSALYEASPTAGILDDSLKARVIAEYKQTTEPSTSEAYKQKLDEESEKLKAYYQKQYALLMNKNEIARQSLIEKEEMKTPVKRHS